MSEPVKAPRYRYIQGLIYSGGGEQAMISGIRFMEKLGDTPKTVTFEPATSILFDPETGEVRTNVQRS